MKENRDLIVTAAKLAAGLVAAGGAVMGLGYAVSAAGAALGLLATTIGALGPVVAVVGPLLATVAAGLASIPVVAIAAAAAIAAISYAIYRTGAAAAAVVDLLKQGFQSLKAAASAGAAALGRLAAGFEHLRAGAMAIVGHVGQAIAIALAANAGAEGLRWLGEQATWLKAHALAVFGGMRDALASGDLGLTARIAWVGMKIAFLHGAEQLRLIWVGFKANVSKLITEAFYGALAAVASAWATMQSTWSSVVAGMKTTWLDFTSGFYGAWRTIIGKVEGGIHELHGLFDESFDATTAVTLAEQNAKADVAGVDKATTLEQARIRQQATKDQKAIDAELKGQLGAIAAAKQKDLAANEAKFSAEIGRANQELQQAKDELAALTGRAREQREQAGTGAGAGPQWQAPTRPAGAGIADRLQEMLGGIQAGVEQAVSSRGIFNAAALQSLQATPTTDAAEQTARNTQKIGDVVEQLRKLNRQASNGGLAFA